MRNKWSKIIAILVIAGMLMGGIGIAYAEPNHVLSGRDRIGTYGKDGKSAREGFINTIVIEGAISNTSETRLSAVEPTSDNLIRLPDNSGTVALTNGAFAGALTGGKMLIGNSADTAVQVTPSGFYTISNTGVSTGQLTDGDVWIGNSGDEAIAVTFSGDITTTNAGVTTIGASKVNAGKAKINTVTLTVAVGTITNSVLVDPGHVLMSYYITTMGGINGVNLVNDLFYDGSGNWVISMINAVSAHSTWTFKFLDDN